MNIDFYCPGVCWLLAVAPLSVLTVSQWAVFGNAPVGSGAGAGLVFVACGQGLAV